MPAIEPNVKIIIEVKCLQAVLYGPEESSTPKQKPTTSLWEAIAPTSNHTYKNIFYLF